mmetsp:Transcript_20988/g.38874  ORF Transcript_20988/g.38874 Transcript_20988/m.38874 type:complete len:189 (+) Transcript_20988:7-573(+)
MWAESFAVTPSSTNPASHDFYRQYFDKQPKSKPPQVIPPLKSEILEPPSLSATLEKRSSRIPVSSKAVAPKVKLRENSWDTRFNITFSKDNVKYPRPLREYFDKPLEFSPDNKDYVTVLQNSALSPVKTRASSVHSKRSKRRTSVGGWILRDSSHDYKWRTASPVFSQVNQQAHPLMRSYFDSPRKHL